MPEDKPPKLDQTSQASSALWFYGRMYLCFVLVPVVPFILRFFIEAALWCYVLANVPGIVFAGGFRAALALSVCLQVIITFLELSLKVGSQVLARRQAKAEVETTSAELLPAEKRFRAERLQAELKGDWRSTFKMLSQRLIGTAVILFLLAQRFPVQLSFASPLYLLGAALLITMVFYLHLTFLKETMILMLEKVKKQSEKFKNEAV